MSEKRPTIADAESAGDDTTFLDRLKDLLARYGEDVVAIVGLVFLMPYLRSDAVAGDNPPRFLGILLAATAVMMILGNGAWLWHLDEKIAGSEEIQHNLPPAWTKLWAATIVAIWVIFALGYVDDAWLEGNVGFGLVFFGVGGGVLLMLSTLGRGVAGRRHIPGVVPIARLSLVAFEVVVYTLLFEVGIEQTKGFHVDLRAVLLGAVLFPLLYAILVLPALFARIVDDVVRTKVSYGTAILKSAGRMVLLRYLPFIIPHFIFFLTAVDGKIAPPTQAHVCIPYQQMAKRCQLEPWIDPGRCPSKAYFEEMIWKGRFACAATTTGCDAFRRCVLGADVGALWERGTKRWNTLPPDKKRQACREPLYAIGAARAGATAATFNCGDTWRAEYGPAIQAALAFVDRPRANQRFDCERLRAPARRLEVTQRDRLEVACRLIDAVNRLNATLKTPGAARELVARGKLPALCERIPAPPRGLPYGPAYQIAMKLRRWGTLCFQRWGEAALAHLLGRAPLDCARVRELATRLHTGRTRHRIYANSGRLLLIRARRACPPDAKPAPDAP